MDISIERSDGIFGDSSLGEILSHSLVYEEQKGFSSIKDSANVSLVFHFLRHIWSSLTEASLCSCTQSDSSKPKALPFIHSDECRKEVADRIIEFLSQFRDDNAEGGDPSSLNLTNVAQGHLLTCFKIISSFLMTRNETKAALVRLSHAITCLTDVFMLLVPCAIDYSTFVDVLTELVRTLSPDSAKVFADYLCRRCEFFYSNIKALEAHPAGARLAQTTGAKLIGLIRALENRLGDILVDDASSHMFNLRIMLTSCLPMSHLGVCNRQSLKADGVTISAVPQDEWNRLVSLSVRKRIPGLSQFEIVNYEAVAGASGFSHSMSGQLFDIKAYMGRTENRPETSEGFIPSYAVYSNYCELHHFIYNPDEIVNKSPEYVEELQHKLTPLIACITTLIDKGYTNDTKLPWALESTGDAAVFISMCNKISFWEEFICSLALALQTIKLSHKSADQNDSIYSSLKEKASAAIDGMENALYQCAGKIANLSARIDRLLCREREWVLWKQKGCQSETPEPVSEDILTDPDVTPVLDDDREESEMHDFLDVMEQLENISSIGSNGLPDVGSNCTLLVEDLRFDRQAEEWYLPKREAPPCSNAYDKLCYKLEDYIEKVKMDDDPVNDIEEQERSKNDSLFRFRFNRMFTHRYVEKYMEMTNDKLEIGSIDCLIDAINSSAKGQNKRPRKKAKT